MGPRTPTGAAEARHRFPGGRSRQLRCQGALERAAASSRLRIRQRAGTEPADAVTPEQQLLRKERAERLKAVLSTLNQKETQLFYRKYYYMQSTAQIAAELGLSERAVEGRLYRLRKYLRKELGGDGL